MNTSFIMIEPHYSDPDTFCTFTVSNGRCRASLDIYVNESKLIFLAESLEADVVNPDSQQIGFSLSDPSCMDIGFLVAQTGCVKTLVVTMVDILNDDAPYRAEIHLHLDADVAADLASELRVWLNNPVCQFIWKQW